jgi:type IV pilus modification protein PilV
MKRRFTQDHETRQQGLPAVPMAGLSARLTADESASSMTGESASSMAGFTLIEVLIAIVILTFGLLAVGSMQVSAIRGNFMGGNTSIALSLASEKMEQLLNADFNSTDTNTDLRDSVTGNNGTLSSTTSVDHQENISEEGVVGANAYFEGSGTLRIRLHRSRRT